MVRTAGLEPALQDLETDFKSGASTDFATSASDCVSGSQGSLEQAAWSGERSNVEPLAHFLAGLEIRDSLGGNVHGCAGAGIAALTRLAVPGRESPEAAQFDASAGLQLGRDGIEYCRYDALDLLGGEVGMIIAEFLHKLGSYQVTTPNSAFSSLNDLACRAPSGRLIEISRIKIGKRQQDQRQSDKKTPTWPLQSGGFLQSEACLRA